MLTCLVFFNYCCWVGDHWEMGKPSWYVTSHSDQLSLAIPPWVGAVSTSDSWDINRHTVRRTSPVSMVSQCKLESGWGLRKRISVPHYVSYLFGIAVCISLLVTGPMRAFTECCDAGGSLGYGWMRICGTAERRHVRRSRTICLHRKKTSWLDTLRFGRLRHKAPDTALPLCSVYTVYWCYTNPSFSSSLTVYCTDRCKSVIDADVFLNTVYEPRFGWVDKAACARKRPLCVHSTIQYNTIQYNTMKNLHSKTDKHTVSLI